MTQKRSWRSRLLELLLWGGVAILTAVVLSIIAEQVLPTNF